MIHKKETAIKRVEFLSNYASNKKISKKIVYLDETWIFRKSTNKTKEWQNKKTKSCSVRSINSGARYIILHAGGENGFAPGAEFILCTSLKTKKGDDYHGDMDAEKFQIWFTNQLLPELSEPTVIVLDNAPYHSVQVYLIISSFKLVVQISYDTHFLVSRNAKVLILHIYIYTRTNYTNQIIVFSNFQDGRTPRTLLYTELK